MRILVDTGVLIRLFERTDSQHQVVLRAVNTLWANGDELVVGFQNVTEFWNVCTRPKTARGGLGLSVPGAEARLRDVEAGFAILPEPPTAYRHWRQLIVTHGVLGKQVHDARLAALMGCHGITHILTLNGADFTRYPGVVALDPAAVAPKPAP
jgi:predicted nucleic acid-binding protein